MPVANEEGRKVRARVRISGWVQGVFFRSSTRDKARSLDVTGWVRNLYDGAVEGLFEGDENAVSRLITWCHHGPPGARVKDVQVEWGEYSGEFDTFFIALSAGSFAHGEEDGLY
jgi:acylphosphatase